MSDLKTQSSNHSTVGKRRNMIRVIAGAIVLFVLAVVLFFAIGGDADVDVEAPSIDIDPGSIDADIEAPDIDVDAPDVDVDPGRVDIDDADADADAGN